VIDVLEHNDVSGFSRVIVGRWAGVWLLRARRELQLAERRGGAVDQIRVLQDLVMNA
jgi:hypothetical protein